MSIDERQRYELHQALENLLGPEAAATLMAYLPRVGRAHVATQTDRHVLRHDLDALQQRIDHRFDALDPRFEVRDPRFEVRDHQLAAEFADLRNEIRKAFRTMAITSVAATTVIVSVAAALTNLFG